MPDELSPAQRYAAAARHARTPALTRFATQLPFALDDFQVDACAALEHGRGVLVAAPTGAGKTVVGEFAVHLALAGGRKAFYTTPIKALSNQKLAELSDRYGAQRIGLLTGDTSLRGDAPVVVMTTEVLRNMLYAGSPALTGLGYVVMDEVHYLADRMRGAVWEEVMIHLPASVQVVSLSATVSNAEEFGEWLTTVRGDTAVVVSEHRPVPLGQHVLVDDRLHDLYARHVDPTDPGVDPPINHELAAVLRGRDDPRRGPHRYGPRVTPRPVLADVLDRAGLLPAITFVFSRAGCQSAVDACLAAGVRLTTRDEAAAIAAVVEQRCAGLPTADLAAVGYDAFAQALARGVAAHHAGLLPLFKEVVEELFAAGLVKLVFATETLALGINMPARSVVLDSLVKWDGSRLADITPGEYTQLTGRAGRRGIDTQGHAVVLARPGLDPVQLAGLASRRTYPLRSSFRPTYNMAVNLVAQVGRDAAREVLETSFAQFQADRAVVGLARLLQSVTHDLESATATMTCSHGDVHEYARLRRDLQAAERGTDRRGDRSAARASLAGLRPGDVLLVPGGRRPVRTVVVDPGGPAGFDGAQPTVLALDGRLRRLTAADVGAGASTVAHLPVPASFDPRSAAARRELALRLRRYRVDATEGPDGGRSVAPTGPDDHRRRVDDLRRELRTHPCHRCPDRDEHLRQGARVDRLGAERDTLTRQIAGRTDSIAVAFDRVCDVLVELDYLRPHGPTQPGGPDRLSLTPAGGWLRRLYAENDLLLAQCLRTGAFDGLDVPALAAAVSALVYRSRREDQSRPPLPGGAGSRLGPALDAAQQCWAVLEAAERAHGLSTTAPIDTGLVAAVHAWAAGRPLAVVLRTGQVEAGDFVRWVKQVVDVLGQLSLAAPQDGTRRTAARAVQALRRGVVEQAGT